MKQRRQFLNKSVFHVTTYIEIPPHSHSHSSHYWNFPPHFPLSFIERAKEKKNLVVLFISFKKTYNGNGNNITTLNNQHTSIEMKRNETKQEPSRRSLLSLSSAAQQFNLKL